MRALEDRLIGQRKSIRELASKIALEKRSEYLSWIENQRTLNSDSLYWWMNQVAGRNNAYSMLFIHWIQVLALKKWVLDNIREDDSLLVVCEDSFIAQTVADAFSETRLINIVRRQLVAFRMLEVTKYLVRATYVLSKAAVFLVSHYIAAARTRSSQVSIRDESVYLVHLCLDDRSFASDERLTSRYFGVLPSHLEEKGCSVARIPWFFDVNLPLAQVYKKIRESDCFVPEDWLSLLDYLKSFFRHIKSSLAIRIDVPCESLTMKHLAIRERLISLGDNHVVFWRYAPAIQKWAKPFKRVININHFERMPPEHVQSFVGKRLDCKFTNIGYVHSIVSSDFLIHHFPNGEVDSSVFPDSIITNGSIYRDLLVSRGVPDHRVLEGPALRQVSRSTIKLASIDLDVLVLLPLVPQATVELLETILKYVEEIRSRNFGRIRLKSHPAMPRIEVLELMKWSELPKGWIWDGRDIPEVFDSTSCVFVMNTSSSIDAVLANCKVITLGRELDLCWNNLDMLENKFKIIQTTRSEHIVHTMTEMVWESPLRYSEELEGLRDCLIKGLNPVTDEWLDVFIDSYEGQELA